MKEAVFGTIGIGIALAAIWYWRAEKVCTFQEYKKRDIIAAFVAVAVSFAAGLYMGSQEWDNLLNIKLAVIYGITLSAAAVDWEKRIISNRLIGGTFLVRLLIFAMEYVLKRETFLQSVSASLWGLLFGFGFLFLVSILSKHSIGFGDVKLFAAIGIYMGFWGTFSILFYSLLYCAFCSVILLVMKKADRKSRIPFAPFIWAGVATAILFRSF